MCPTKPADHYDHRSVQQDRGTGEPDWMICTLRGSTNVFSVFLESHFTRCMIDMSVGERVRGTSRWHLNYGTDTLLTSSAEGRGGQVKAAADGLSRREDKAR